MNDNIINNILKIHNNLFSEKKTFDNFKAIFENKKYFIKYILEKNEIMGYIIVYDSFDSYELFEIAVDTIFQKKGYGLILLDSIPKNKDIFLEVSENNFRAKDIYLKNGFKVISIRKNYYKDGSNAIIMKKSKE